MLQMRYCSLPISTAILAAPELHLHSQRRLRERELSRRGRLDRNGIEALALLLTLVVSRRQTPHHSAEALCNITATTINMKTR